MPAAEAPLVERWDGKALLYDYCDHRIERFVVDRVLPAGSTHVWGDLEWSALAAPGHDMGALVFYNAEHRILISGDALWEHGFGFVMPPGDRRGRDARDAGDARDARARSTSAS